MPKEPLKPPGVFIKLSLILKMVIVLNVWKNPSFFYLSDVFCFCFIFLWIGCSSCIEYLISDIIKPIILEEVKRWLRDRKVAPQQIPL